MKPTRLLAACLAAAAFLAGPQLAAAQDAPAQADAAHGEKLYALCATCHGEAGEGNQAVGAPAIAGMPAWYVESQLVKFSRGLRGKHFDDAEGMRMRPMSLWLIASRRAARVAAGEPADSADVDPNIRDAAAFVASMPPVQPAPTVTGGNVEAGQTAYAACGSCHGQNGEGTEALTAPPLTNQSDWYVLRSLEKYKAGVRGYDANNDALAFTMASMAGALLPDEQSIKDMVAFIATMKK
jgi:cytochrome c553